MSIVENVLDVSKMEGSDLELFSLIEQDIGLLDLTNSLKEEINIEVNSLFSDNHDESLNSMIKILGDEEDSIMLMMMNGIKLKQTH